MAVPREGWKATDFVVDDMVYSSIDVLIMDALRHLQCLEKNSTLRLYTAFIYHYKKWAAKMLKQIRDKLPHEQRLRHVDEIGHYIHDNKKKDWCNEKVVRREYIWLHGPKVTEARLRAYVKQMSRECNLIADQPGEENNATRTGPVRSTTMHTILGRIKACQMAARVEATLYREKELGIMREISVVRSEVRFNVRHKNERDIKNCADRRRGTIGDTYTAEQFRQIMMRVLPTWAASAWNPRATTPSQTLWRFLLIKVLTLLSHHTLLRGASIREITLPDVFLYHLASTSDVNPDSQPVVMVIAARNSKTSKDARLQQSYAARHLEAELCAVGETGLWLHFILDQIGQFSGTDFLSPLDTTERERWYKKHLFFARNDKEQEELSSATHQRWTRQMWRTNKVFGKRNVHAARAGGAQELAIGGTPRAQIAELGHWALDKMTRAYITAIPVGVVMQKAGYSGLKQDYFLGRSRVEPSDKLLDLLAEHIFPGVDAMLRDEALKKEVERSALEKLGYQETIEKQNDTIASFTAELARLTEALRVSEARRMPAAPPSATDQTPGEGGSADSANTGTGAKRDDGKPPPPPQTAEEASYELNVVQPWRDSKTVRDAWRLWNSATANDTRRLCDRVAEPGFIDRHTLLKGATQGALNMRVRRMLKAMDAVRQLRVSDGDADTEAVVDALNTIAAPGIGTFCDALTVLNPETAPTMSKEPGMGVKGLGPKVVSKLRLACALVALELKPTTWVDRLFPDTWEDQMPKTEADLAKQTAPAQRPPSKRKKSA
ncbi:unnamed protein product [Closterium sp. NIES-65]|nr:unnamed protein product [Closterium sp. NIES-65]